MTLPDRYWVWLTYTGHIMRFDDAEADRINTRLDEWHDDVTSKELGFLRATDLAGTEVRLRISLCNFFYESTPESREFDKATRKELEREDAEF